jgi:hypothetical protein
MLKNQTFSGSPSPLLSTVERFTNVLKINILANSNINITINTIVTDIVLPELQRFYGRAIVIITPVEMPISDINKPLSIIIFVLYLSVYRLVLGRIYD